MFRNWIRVLVCAAPVVSLSAAPVQAQMFFEAHALMMDRNQGDGSDWIVGPESVSTDPGNFSFEPGYRLTFGGYLGEWQVDASFSQVNPWVASQNGVFTREVVFDDNAANPFVVATAPANALSGLMALRQASMSSLDGADETTEGELLRAGAGYSAQIRTNYRDFEINLGSNRNTRRWRFSAGYRHIRWDESNQLRLGGEFDAIDADDGSVFGDPGNSPNDGLSHNALENAGMIVVRGAADGFNAYNTPDGVDFLAYEVSGRAHNELNGAQATAGVVLFDGDWVTLEGIGKAGIYRNRASGRVQETIAGSGNDDSVYQRTLTDDRFSAAFAGNLGLRGVVSVTDYINVIAGYEILFLAGMALSPEQLNGLSTNALGETVYQTQTNGSVIAHGGTLGLEITW